MFFVKSSVSGVWRTVDVFDINGHKYGEKVLIRAQEVGRWSVDGRPVEVEPGIAVSFRDPIDADWFLSQGRASIITVEFGSIVAFESETDAQWYVRARLAEMISRAEVDAAIAAANVHQGASDAPVAVDADSKPPAVKAKRKTKAKV